MGKIARTPLQVIKISNQNIYRSFSVRQAKSKLRIYLPFEIAEKPTGEFLKR